MSSSSPQIRLAIPQSPAVWRGPSDCQRQLFDVVAAGSDLPIEQKRPITLAMLEAGSDATAESVTGKFGPVAVDGILSWFYESERQTPEDLPAGWRRAISMYSSVPLDWLDHRQQVREATGALITEALNPHSAEVYRYGTGLWITAIQGGDRTVPLLVHNRFYTFLFALGFDAPDGEPDELVALTFGAVHAALTPDETPSAEDDVIYFVS